MEENKTNNNESKKDAKPKTKEKANQKNKLQQFYENVKSEFKKVIWPTKQELVKQTLVVIVISLFMGVIISGIDAVFGVLLSFVTRLAG